MFVIVSNIALYTLIVVSLSNSNSLFCTLPFTSSALASSNSSDSISFNRFELYFSPL